MKVFSRAPLALLLAGLSCASRAEPARSATSPPPLAPVVTEIPRTVVTPDDAASIPELFDRARQMFAKEDFAGAAAAFERIVALDPKGELTPDSLFYAGWSYDNLGRNAEALSRYEQVARRYPEHRLARDGLTRSIRLAAHLEEWSRAGELADRVLSKRDSLGAIEQVVAYGGKALALVAAGDPDAASYFVEKGRNVVEAFRLNAAGAIPRDLAQLYYALGEVRRLRGEKIDFVPPVTDFASLLERRCQLLLDAQSAYSDSMRAYDSHWSAMAGYRVGELYRRLHEDLMKVPPPVTAHSERRRALFEGAMRLRYSVLLQKGRAMLEHTVAMAERTDERSAWVERARESLRAIDAGIKTENAALDRLPYSRADLQKAFDDLAAKKAGTEPSRP